MSFDRTCKWETVFCCMLHNSINCYLGWSVCRSVTICFFSLVQCMVFCVCISCCLVDCLSVLVIQSLSLFCRVHATLQPTLSVGPLVPWSNCPSNFLVACYATLHPALSVRRSVGQSVRPSVRHTLLFFVFFFMYSLTAPA